MPNYHSVDCSESDLLQLEVRLKQNGFIQTANTIQKDIQLKEYFKRPYSGTTTSFDGPKRWTVTYRIQ